MSARLFEDDRKNAKFSSFWGGIIFWGIKSLLFWESQITEPEFHFYKIVKPAAVSFLIEDIKGDIFTEKGTQVMIDAANSLKATTPAKPNS